jgi:GntR family transcriptional repressor for pyruvate dehydrogenase complex
MQHEMLVPIDRSKVYKVVFDRIKNLVDSGEWPAGMKLPPERVLAEKLAVGRPSVREAIRILEATGYIEIITGQGSFVRDRSKKDIQQEHLRLLQSMLTEDENVVDLLEVREMLEPNIAAMAAADMVQDDIENLERIMLKMEANPGNMDAVVEENINFHLALTRSTGNKVLEQMHKILLESAREPFRRFLQIPGRIEQSLDGHRQLLNAIRSRDPENARSLMLSHLRKRYVEPDTDAMRAAE